MKRIRNVIVALLGLFYVGLLYPLYTDLWRSKWLIAMGNDRRSFFVAGEFLSGSSGDCLTCIFRAATGSKTLRKPGGDREDLRERLG